MYSQLYHQYIIHQLKIMNNLPITDSTTRWSASPSSSDADNWKESRKKIIISEGPTSNSGESLLNQGTGITGFNNNESQNVTNQTDIIPILSIQDSLLNDSRITPVGNGNLASKPYCIQPTNGQKWWAAVLLGFLFALISSPAAYYVTSKITTSLGGITLMDGSGPNFVGLSIHTMIFIIIVRIILW